MRLSGRRFLSRFDTGAFCFEEEKLTIDEIMSCGESIRDDGIRDIGARSILCDS